MCWCPSFISTLPHALLWFMINPSQSQPTDLCPERWKEGGGCFPKGSIPSETHIENRNIEMDKN